MKNRYRKRQHAEEESMREAWKIHDFQASKVVPSPHAVFCGMVLHRYKNANSLF